MTEEKKRLKDQLEAEASRSKIYYHQYYQQMMRDKIPKTSQPGQRASTQGTITSDILAKVRDAYGDAFAVRAFQDVLGPAKEQQAQQPQQEAEERPRSQFINAWTRWAEKDPDNAKAFIEGLTEEQMAKIALMDTAKDQDMRFFNMIGAAGGKSSISDIMTILDKLPKQPTAKELVDTSLALAQQITPKRPEKSDEDSAVVELMKQELSELKENNKKLDEYIRAKELQDRDRENAALRDELKDIRQKIPTADQLFDMAIEQETKVETWAQKRGWAKTGGTESKEDKDREFLEGVIDDVLEKFTPVIEAGADRIAGKVSGEPGQQAQQQGQQGQKYARMRCQGKTKDGKTCTNILTVPNPVPPGFYIRCPKCGMNYGTQQQQQQEQQAQQPAQEAEKTPSKGSYTGYYVENSVV